MIARVLTALGIASAIVGYYATLWLCSQAIGFDLLGRIGVAGTAALSGVFGIWWIARKAPIREDLDLPEGFTPWAGGDPLLPDNTRVEILCRDGQYVVEKASVIDWTHRTESAAFDVIAYRVLGSTMGV